MSLKEKLEEQKKQSAEKIPADAREVMARATEELEKSGLVDNVLGPGDRAPEFSLPNVHGEVIDSRALLRRGPLVLSVYRGVW